MRRASKKQRVTDGKAVPGSTAGPGAAAASEFKRPQPPVTEGTPEEPLDEKPISGQVSIGEVLRKRREVPESLRRARELKREVVQGNPALNELQKKKGKLTARERIEYLVDRGSFEEIGLLMRTRSKDFGLDKKAPYGDGVVTGFARINGRKVGLFVQDFTSLGGSLGLAHAQKIVRIMDLAEQARVPVIGLLDSGGARIQEGVDSLDGYARIFQRNVRLSGVVPQISVVLGPCAGGAVYSPALTDFVFMVSGLSHMFVTGPAVVKEATGETVDFETLGGGELHAGRSGVCHFLAHSEQQCLWQVKELLSFLPQSRWENPPALETSDPPSRRQPILEKLCSIDPRKPYLVHHGLYQIADDRKFLEVHRHFARNVVTGFIRLGGRTIGVVANNPRCNAGALDIDASEKAARFVRFLNNFNIPILTVVDVPGYWPGTEQERGGIIRHGAKLLYAYAEATVPKVTLISRKAYGGAYIAMGSKYLHADLNFAYPCAEIAVMGAAGAVNILYGKELAASPEPEKLRQKLAAEYSARFASPYPPAETGSIDAVIEPCETRERLIAAFETLKDKRRPGEGEARGNIPL